MFRLAQLSDLHLVRAGRLCMDRVDTAALLDAALAALRPLRPDALLLSGDLSDDGSPASYAGLRERLRALGLPCVLLPGNHDERGALRDAFPEQWPAGTGPGEALCQDRALGPLRVLALDTLRPGRADGGLDSAQLDWLADALARQRDRPTLLALHHPPRALGLPFMDAMRLFDGADALARIVARAPQLLKLLCGHVHRHIETTFAGLPLSVAPSCAHQIVLGAPGAHEAAWRLEPPGLLLHDWDDGLGLLTHHVAVGDFGPPQHYGD
ncbi:phosphodiesterase [Pelomonas sp. CA6]|uniref:phosphodiesterase n=1 Tax=Pelomonas sp. CA6 TaxID=2907999 RepID=UPI001F4C019C|nr:phosphodiesterase [Pelomonas sp. CA6]MCH7343640.1 phosphodiesterase [Pelomonas sp. CA6]